MNVSVLCVNDSMKLVFAPGTPSKVIEQHIQETKEQYAETHKHDKIPPMMYVHTHRVEYFDEHTGG